MLLLSLLTGLAVTAAGSVSVMVFGDSYGDTGPTYHQVQKMFDDRKHPATVRSAAVGGTAACEWASKENGQAIVTHAKTLFPDLKDGPDFLWYTAGANDVWQNIEFQACQKLAKTWDGVQGCMKVLMDKVADCTANMLTAFFKAFPKAKVMQSGYDVPCSNRLCEATFTGVFDMHYCGKHNATCNNQAMFDFITIYIDALNKKFPEPRYETLFMMGTVQKAAGIPGADVGKPVLNTSSNCAWETECVHPTYNTPAGNAWGNAFWDFYFSKHVANATTESVVV